MHSAPPTKGQSTVATELAVMSPEFKQMLAFRLQIGVVDVVVVVPATVYMQ